MNGPEPVKGKPMPDDEEPSDIGGHDPPPGEAILNDPTNTEPSDPDPPSSEDPVPESSARPPGKTRTPRKPRQPRQPKTPPEPKKSLDDLILEAALGPKSVTVDGQNVTAHDLKQLIDADRHLAARKAARKPVVRFTKMVSPGAE